MYRDALADVDGISFMPEPPAHRSTFWLTTLTIEEHKAGASRDSVIAALEAENIESRPVWKPMHLQPLYRENRTVGGAVAERLFATGLCLPSGTDLTGPELERI